MLEGRPSVDWRRTAAIALVVVAACLAAALVPHTVGAFGNDVVVIQPGPPPSVNAELDDARQRFQNRMTNRITDVVPVLVPAFGSLAAFLAGRRRTGVGSTASSARLTDAVGAFAGGALGYALFVGVAILAYGAVPGGYLLESYPPPLRVATISGNAVLLGLLSAVGGVVAGAAARALDRSPESS